MASEVTIATPATDVPAPSGRRMRLVWKYAVPFVAVVVAALLANGGVEMYFGYQESKEALARLQQEKAAGAAIRIQQFVHEIEHQMAWATQPQLVAGPAALEQRRIDYLRLLRQAPLITELSYIDPSGHEQVRVSRLAVDVVGGNVDVSNQARFLKARQGPYYGPVTFRKESEPYMTVALPHAGGAGVTAAELNLKFIWDIVSQIHIGRRGYAYVVDGAGQLVAHPDISLVLKKTDFSAIPTVRRALSTGAAQGVTAQLIGSQNEAVLAAHVAVKPPGWFVIVEQPLAEAFEPLRGSMRLSAVLILFGVAASIVASVLVARRMVRPIQALDAGAARIGSGDLSHRIAVRTGDELEALAAQFNRMTERLQDSYATLEQRVVERTAELEEALERQRATANILRVISSSPTDVQPVFEAIAASAARLSESRYAWVVRYDGQNISLAAAYNLSPEQRAMIDRIGPVRADRSTAGGQAILDRGVVQIDDVLDEPSSPIRAEFHRALGYRSLVAVPMLKERDVLGAIIVYRTEVKPFNAGQVALVQTFADQAVIAIENVRLFHELQARSAELTRSVGELRALGEVGRTISSTLDLDIVLDTIVSRATQLTSTDGGAIFEYDAASQRFELRATHNYTDDFVAALRATSPMLGEGAVGRAAQSRVPVQIPDIAEPGAFTSRVRDALIAGGYRALLAVPLTSEEEVVGALVVNRRLAGAFTPEVVDLLATFASQSALAIRNARLFREIEDKTRQLEAANKHKDEFLASMSHELRTPLNAVIGFSEVLLERMFGALNDKQEEYLNDILSSGRHLLSLINDILDLAKIEAGRMELQVVDFDLPQSIANALMLIRERATRKSIALDTTIDAGLGSVRGDERKIKQVLVNLLSNAVKFTPEGGHIEVRGQCVDGDAEISVSDTGIGIAPEDQLTVFEEFRQVGTDYARKREGTGLGLALSKKFVELHGGRLWVKSEVGHGSTFTFTIPVK